MFVATKRFYFTHDNQTQYYNRLRECWEWSKNVINKNQHYNFLILLYPLFELEKMRKNGNLNVLLITD